jgi:phage terminase large subunit-like protein
MEARRELLKLLTPEQSLELKFDWYFWGRDKQRPPEGDWTTWLIKAGRGWGKTLTGAHWLDCEGILDRHQHTGG